MLREGLRFVPELNSSYTVEPKTLDLCSGRARPTPFNERLETQASLKPAEASERPTLPVRRTSRDQAGSWKEGPAAATSWLLLWREKSATERITEPSCLGGGGLAPPPFPFPLPLPLSGPPAPAPLGEARPPPPSGQEDKQGWNRTGQDGMSSGQSRTGGPRLPPASREGMGVTTGSLHPSTQPAPSVPPTGCREYFPSAA